MPVLIPLILIQQSSGIANSGNFRCHAQLEKILQFWMADRGAPIEYRRTFLYITGLLTNLEAIK